MSLSRTFLMTVRHTQPVELEGGGLAIVLETQERGPLAFEVDLQILDLIRAELDRVEVLLRQGT